MTSLRILNRTVLPLVPNDLQPYEYQITYTLEPFGDTTFVSCSTVVSDTTLQTNHVDGQGPANIGAAVTPGDTTPYLTLVYIAICNSATFLNGTSTTLDALASGWANPLSQPFGFAGHTMSNFGYRSDAAGNPLWKLSDGTNPVNKGVQLAFTIPHGSIVQFATAFSGSAITWASPLTTGNLVILGRTAEGPTGWSAEPGIGGVLGNWDRTLASIDGALDAAGSNVGLYATCVTAGMGTLSPGGSSTSHWFHAVEIAIS
jgi:hypothetical protein